MSRLKLAALAFACLIAACATRGLPPRAPEPFDLSGRVSVTHDGRAFTSSLRWQHLPDRDEIWLLTPLGQALAHIVSTAEGATVTGADRKQVRGPDVEALTRQALGWELPLTRLQYWIRGEPAPGGSANFGAAVSVEGRTEFAQDDWHISVVRYPESEQAGRPHRIELRRGEEQVIRLVIDAWRSDPAP